MPPSSAYRAPSTGTRVTPRQRAVKARPSGKLTHLPSIEGPTKELRRVEHAGLEGPGARPGGSSWRCVACTLAGRCNIASMEVGRRSKRTVVGLTPGDDLAPSQVDEVFRAGGVRGQ